MRDVLQAVDVASPNGKPAQLNAHVLLEVSDSRRAVDNVLQHCVKVLTDVRPCHCTFGECGKDEQKYNEPPPPYLRSGGPPPPPRSSANAQRAQCSARVHVYC